MSVREGSLEAPTRHPLDWKNPEFYDEEKLFAEMERVFDICHGCRRCVSLCGSFPTLFDLVDESPTLEVDGVPKEKYWKVVDQCYLCDVCYMTKCPYVPPHPWNLDFPHLMLRAKAVKFASGKVPFKDKLLASTDGLGTLATIPVVMQVTNALNKSAAARSRDGEHARRGQDRVGARVRRREVPLERGEERRLPGEGRQPHARARWRSSRPATSTTTSPASATTSRRSSTTTRSPT